MKENIFNTANNITFVRIFISFIATILILTGDIYMLMIAIILIAYSELTDMLDGYIARRDNCVTNLGKLLDPLSDSISRFLYFFAFGYMGLFPVWLVVFLFVRDIIVAYIRTYMSLTGVAMGARFSGKLKAVVQFGGQYLLLFILVIFYLNNGQEIEESMLITLTLIGTICTFIILKSLKVEGKYLMFSILGYTAFLIPFYLINKFELTFNYTVSTSIMAVVIIVTLYSLIDYLIGLKDAMTKE